MIKKDVKAKIKTEEHQKMVKEHIRYVCEQAIKNKQKVAEICLTRLQDGEYLEKEEVEEYAKENNHTIEGTFDLAGTTKCVKMHLSRIK